MSWTPSARRAAAAAIRERRASYMDLVRALLVANPELSTDEIAARMGYHPSTIRRWRARLRES